MSSPRRAPRSSARSPSLRRSSRPAKSSRSCTDCSSRPRDEIEQLERALRPRSEQARAPDCRRPRVSACRQSRSRGDDLGTRGRELQGISRVCMWRWARCGSRPRKSAATRATCERRSRRSNRSPRSRPRPARRSACTAARWCWRGGMRKRRRSSGRRRSAFLPIPRCCRIFASVAQRLGHLDEARQALVKYSVLVDEDRRRSRARGAHCRSVDAAERRGRGRRVVSEIGCAASERRVAARADGRRTVRARVRSRTRSRPSSGRSRRTRTILSCARSPRRLQAR